LTFISKDLYRKIFLMKKLNNNRLWKKQTNRTSTNIPKILINKKLLVYNGKHWNKRVINKWMVGFKLGEFVWTRKLALFKAKQQKKKSKK
jgi:ribosomal protein S19